MVGLEAATHFEFEGDGVAGVVGPTSDAGELSGTVTVDGHSFPIVATRRGVLGWMGVAVYLGVPDAYTLVAHVVLPEVNTGGSSEPFEGLVVIVREQSNIGGPRFVRGALQTYKVRAITGTASTVASP